MTLPVFIPAALETSELDSDDVERLRASWSAWWEPFREELRASPPAEGSREEGRAVATLAGHISKMMVDFGPAFAAALEWGIEHAIETILIRASADVDDARRLGFHWLETSLAMLDRVIAHVAAMAPPEAMTQELIQLDETEFEENLDHISVAILRLELCAFVALDLIAEGEPTEFCEWAKRACGAARTVDVWIPYLSRVLGPPVPNDMDLRPEVTLDARSTEKVLRLIDEAPGPNEAMLELFRGDDPQAQQG